MRLKLSQSRVGARSAGGRIDDHADAMAAAGLAGDQVDHMAEQPAERRAQDVQDIERRRGIGAHHAGRFHVHIGRNGRSGRKPRRL